MSCTRKTFPTSDAALTARGDHPLTVVKCIECSGWHLLPTIEPESYTAPSEPPMWSQVTVEQLRTADWVLAADIIQAAVDHYGTITLGQVTDRWHGTIDSTLFHEALADLVDDLILETECGHIRAYVQPEPAYDVAPADAVPGPDPLTGLSEADLVYCQPCQAFHIGRACLRSVAA